MTQKHGTDYRVSRRRPGTGLRVFRRPSTCEPGETFDIDAAAACQTNGSAVEAPDKPKRGAAR